jgi:hypothetical protein
MVQSQGKELRLSTKGLENVAALAIKDFTLHVGQRSVSCSRFEASFISPRITTAISTDATLTEYELKIDDSGSVDLNCLADVVSLSRNGSFVLNSSNVKSTLTVVECLGNQELIEQLMEFARPTGELTLSNVRERLSLADALDAPRFPEIEYLASHIYEVDINVLKSLSHSCLREVFGSDKLQLESEDSLLNSILGLGRGYFDFLGNVRSEYLSVSGIDRLLTSISIDEIDGEVWSGLCRRLRLSVKPQSILESRFCLHHFTIDSSRRFDGIVSWLTRKCGGNVHKHGVVSITASSSYRHDCCQVADYNWHDYWYSRNQANSWIQFDFKHRQVSVTNYSIKSDGTSCNHLLHWSLQGSNDGQSWTVLDQRDTQDLNDNYIVQSYECGSHQSSQFQFIRLIQTGPNSSNYNHLMLANLEFFGSISRWPKK